MKDYKVNILKKVVRVITFSILLLTSSLFSANTVRIMPLGDSITKGYIIDDPSNESGYRGPLWSKLVTYGYDFDFVGSTASGENYDPLFDTNHDGYNGWTTGQLNNNIDTLLDAVNPQVILLHIGTNDIRQSGYDVTTSTNNVESILDKIYSHDASIKVILARIIDQNPNDSNTTIFNDSVVAMANNHNADINIVDMENGAGIDYSTEMPDGVHPLNSGYAKMADVWYSTLKTIIPMHLWKLEEITGSTTYLDTYREANGTCIGTGCPISVTGKVGDAQEFDGIEDKINVNNTTTFDWTVDANITIEFWMKTNPSSGNTYEVMIGRKGPRVNDLNDRWYVGIHRPSGQITYGLGNSDGNETNGIGSSVIDDGNWNHIAYVITSDRLMLYVNGLIDVNRTRTYPGTEHIQGTSVNIGYLNQHNDFEYTGILDEITVYDSALSASQIKQHYGALEITSTPITFAELNVEYSYDVNSNKDPIDSFSLSALSPDWLTISDPAAGVITGTPDTVGNYEVEVEATNDFETATQNYVLHVRNTAILPDGMNHYWKLDETSGSIYLDSYSGADGTCISSTCPVPTTGLINGAQEFDGSHKIDVNDTSTFDWKADANVTIEFWMKSDQPPTVENTVMIGRKGLASASAQDIWFLGVEKDTGKITYGLGNANGQLQWNSINTIVTDGLWKHIAYVITSNKLILYVNGEKILDNNRTYPATEHIQGTPVNIGYLDWNSHFEYIGLLDEIVVFDSALSQSEIQEHMTKGQSGEGFETKDVTPPVITLIGSDVSIELGTSYIDAGATAADNIDGNITENIVTVNPVNINAVGIYTVTYDVNDSAGNSASQVTRTVTVTADVTPPVITLIGSDVSIELGTSYIDAGATASDNIDGDITANIVTVNPVNVNAVGVYTVTYDVNDSAGNSASQVTRTVTVTADATPPVITLIGSDVSIELGTSYIDAGATAADNIDGNITENIVTVNPVNINAVGIYTVTYDVNDSAGNSASQVTRTVTVTADVTPPVITLIGNTPIDVWQGSVYIDDGATAVDNMDGNITGNIVTVNPVDTDTVGQYTVTYNVSDTQGNAATEVTRTVNVIDDTIPIITLLGETPVNVLKGSIYIDEDATALDNVDGNITGNIITVNPVDTDTVGQYIVTYNVSDKEGNAATEVVRIVNVVDESTISSGGGCSYNPDSKNFDMTFLLMIALGIFYPFRRRFIK